MTVRWLAMHAVGNKRCLAAREAWAEALQVAPLYLIVGEGKIRRRRCSGLLWGWLEDIVLGQQSLRSSRCSDWQKVQWL